MALSIQIKMPHVSTVPADAVIHTWAFGGTDSSDGPSAALAIDRLFDFYAVEETVGDGAPADYMADTIDWGLATATAYVIEDPEPRVPIAVQGFAQAPNHRADNALVSEVALVLSFHAAIASGQNAQRRRGRVFLGPLNSGAANLASGVDCRPLTSFLQAVQLGAATLAQANDATLYWGVWSRSDATVRRVVGGHVDNAFDTQRRRGVAADDRLLFTE